MAYALVLIPLVSALIALLVPSDQRRPYIVTMGGAAQAVAVVFALREPRVSGLGEWLLLDLTGKLVLGVTSALFFVCSLYAPAYLRRRTNRSNRVFCACLLTFDAMMALIAESHHLGLMWVGLEAATLSTAPLLYFNHSQRSLEAVWKYLLIGSVGIALALLGSLFLAYSALSVQLAPSLLLEDLLRDAPRLSKPWLHAAFVILFVGYGTKMGLAPMHTWKPDAYGEAPGVVGALLAGGITNCAFLAIVRFARICHAAGDGLFARHLMLPAGLLSMAVAGAFMARQRDFKRMLAYSSVEHMGILMVGLGLGGLGVFGSLLHMINNGLTKGVLFLSAGNIHRAFGSKSVDEVSGALRVVPASAGLFLAGFFAITGSPPFAPFLSEFTIARAAFREKQYGVGALFLVLLAVVFVGMGAAVVAVVQGEPSARGLRSEHRDELGTVAPIALCLAAVLLLGLYVPPPLERLITEAAAGLGGGL
ncbi:MAG TPA: proton-conducting transporter membrane subunit [Polyangiaceae bacterium]|nr:proton-conducting transporter membrane subunit [Polyangiaceae bacterium]